MRKRLFILLVVLALLVVPVAAEEKNWNYNLTSSLQTVSSGLAFGCNLSATDYVDPGYDLLAPPPPPSGPNGYAVLRIYQSAGVYSADSFVQALNGPMSPSNDETVFTLEFKADTTTPATLQIPFTRRVLIHRHAPVNFSVKSAYRIATLS